jgi:hypothetical protein
MVQTAVADPTLREGQWSADFPASFISRVAEGALSVGRLVGWGTHPERQVLEPAAVPGADADAIMTAAATVLPEPVRAQ